MGSARRKLSWWWLTCTEDLSLNLALLLVELPLCLFMSLNLHGDKFVCPCKVAAALPVTEQMETEQARGLRATHVAEWLGCRLWLHLTCSSLSCYAALPPRPWLAVLLFLMVFVLMESGSRVLPWMAGVAESMQKEHSRLPDRRAELVCPSWHSRKPTSSMSRPSLPRSSWQSVSFPWVNLLCYCCQQPVRVATCGVAAVPGCLPGSARECELGWCHLVQVHWCPPFPVPPLHIAPAEAYFLLLNFTQLPDRQDQIQYSWVLGPL